MDDFSVVVWWIIGALVAAVVMYGIIRLAVTHAIRASRVESPDRH